MSNKAFLGDFIMQIYFLYLRVAPLAEETSSNNELVELEQGVAGFASNHAEWKRCCKVSAICFLVFFRETISALPCVDPADVHRYGCTDAGHKATSAT